MLTFYSMDLEKSSDCGYDKLEVFDGKSNSSKLAEKLCGQGKPNLQFIGSNKEIYVQFKSDYSVNGKGFKIGYKTIKLDKSCGFRPGESEEFMSSGIIGGIDAAPNSWPWQALIYVHLENSIPRCGGTILSDQYILTAAHCVR